jgi:hypothetical protein
MNISWSIRSQEAKPSNLGGPILRDNDDDRDKDGVEDSAVSLLLLVVLLAAAVVMMVSGSSSTKVGSSRRCLHWLNKFTLPCCIVFPSTEADNPVVDGNDFLARRKSILIWDLH